MNSFPISTCDFTVKLNGYGERRIDANNVSASLIELVLNDKKNSNSFLFGFWMKNYFRARIANPHLPSQKFNALGILNTTLLRVIAKKIFDVVSLIPQGEDK